MSETELSQSVALPLPATPPPVQAAAPRRRPVWPVFFILGFLILAVGEAYLYQLHVMEISQGTELAVLQAQVSDLRTEAARAAPAPDSLTVQADLGMKLAALGAEVNAVEAQTAADHGALATLQSNAANLTALTSRMNALSTLETARIALESGQPLGNLPNAPAAIAAFATTPPPTEAELRLTFPDAARAAESASIAGDAHGNFWSRVLARLESLITLSDGSHVIIGAPAAGVIDAAQASLEAGDLAGAVAQLETLSVSTQQAMGNWLVQAKALVAARAALVQMSGR